MDKDPRYGSPPPAGFAAPPGYDPGSAYPPPAYPPTSYPPNSYPPNNYPANNYPAQPPTNTVVITGGPTIIASFGPNSQSIVCPHCHHSISTRVDNSATTKTHLCALFLCLFLCWPCCCCPYCMDSCQAQNHYCPKCNAFLGTYNS